jgi:signal transduction histidine kinase
MPANSDDHVASAVRDEQESLLPELLHALNQPLTALRCSLEMTLLQPRDSDEYRKRLRDSLRLAEEITTLTGGIREMVDAERPCDHAQCVDVSALWGTTVREFLPVAASRGVSLSLLCTPSLATLGDPYQFSKAFFYLLDFVLSDASKGDELTVQAGPEGDQIEVTLDLLKSRSATTSTRDTSRPKVKSYLAFLIARRLLEVSGGGVRFQREATQSSLRVRLPQASSSGSDATCPQLSSATTKSP